MSTIVFHGENGLAQVTLEKTAELKIAGGAISAGGPLAWYENGVWHLGSRRFERITCQGPVRVEFHDRTGPHSYGPFDELTIGGEVMFTAFGILARYQPFDEIWHFDRHSESETMVVRDATSLLAT